MLIPKKVSIVIIYVYIRGIKVLNHKFKVPTRTPTNIQYIFELYENKNSKTEVLVQVSAITQR